MIILLTYILNKTFSPSFSLASNEKVILSQLPFIRTYFEMTYEFHSNVVQPTKEITISHNE